MSMVGAARRDCIPTRRVGTRAPKPEAEVAHASSTHES